MTPENRFERLGSWRTLRICQRSNSDSRHSIPPGDPNGTILVEIGYITSFILIHINCLYKFQQQIIQ